MPIPLVPVAAVGVLGLLALFAGGDDDGPTTGPVGPGVVPSMTCEQAVAALPPSIAPEVRAAVISVLAAPSLTAAQASNATGLALALETAASTPGLAPMQRQALLTCAQCVRQAVASKPAPATPPIVGPKPPPVVTPPVTPPADVYTPPKDLGPKLAAPQNYGDANGVLWLVTNPAPFTWQAELDQAPPHPLYATGLPFLRDSRDAIRSAIEERAAMVAGAL